MKQRRDAATVPAASPAPAPRPAVASPPSPLLARTARPRPVRHVRSGFMVASGPRRAEVHQQAQQQLQCAALAELGARGISITSDRGSDLAGRMHDYRVEQAIKQVVRQRIGQGGFQQ